MIIVYESTLAKGGLNLLGGKDGIHLHQRQFWKRKAYAKLWDTLGVTSDVGTGIKCSSLCNLLLQECHE